MKKTPIFATIGILLSAVTPSYAQAPAATDAPTPKPITTKQVPAAMDAPTPKPITIKLGGFFPTGSGTKNALGNTWFAISGEYAFNKPGTSVVPIAFLDYTGKSKDDGIVYDNGAGDTASLKFDVSSIGLGGGVRVYTGSDPDATVRPYFGGGLGIFFNRVKLSASGTGTLAGNADISKNKTNLGFKLNAGVEFQKMYLAEINYVNSGKVSVADGSDADFSGFNVLVGARF